MSRRSPVNIAASIRQRLQNHARERREDFQQTLTFYVIERLLYRLGHSAYSNRFVLKGAMLYRAWGENTPRTTRDLDLLGSGDCSMTALTKVFRDLSSERVDVADGVVFDADTVQVVQIAELAEYEGVRVSLWAQLDSARIKVQVDVGVGDAVVPPPTVGHYPTLVGLPAPKISMYPREAVVAEKFHTIVFRGLGNSRMKDYYDLWFLAGHFEFEGVTLAQAVRTTFERRSTALPTKPPPGLAEEFWGDRSRQASWGAFLRRTGAIGAGELRLEEAARVTLEFVMPVTQDPIPGQWSPGGPWQKSDEST